VAATRQQQLAPHANASRDAGAETRRESEGRSACRSIQAPRASRSTPVGTPQVQAACQQPRHVRTGFRRPGWLRRVASRTATSTLLNSQTAGADPNLSLVDAGRVGQSELGASAYGARTGCAAGCGSRPIDVRCPLGSTGRVLAQRRQSPPFTPTPRQPRKTHGAQDVEWYKEPLWPTDSPIEPRLRGRRYQWPGRDSRSRGARPPDHHAAVAAQLHKRDSDLAPMPHLSRRRLCSHRNVAERDTSPDKRLTQRLPESLTCSLPRQGRR
jgi:hypothetical protein